MHPERNDDASQTTMRESPLFVVGAARSGTTLLRSLLERHPDVAIPPESHFIPDFYRRRERYGSESITRLDLFLKDLALDPRFKRWDLPIEAVERELLRPARLTLSGALGGVFMAYAASRGATRWGDKTPRYVEHISLLAELFPSARFVHLLRDGRDVALSVLAIKRLHRRAASAAYLWRRQICAGRRAGDLLGPDRYLEIRYEDLLDDLEGGLRTLCGFLELPFDLPMLEHDEGALDRVPPGQRRMHSRLALPPTKGLRDWRTEMTRAELAEFEAVAGRELVACRYLIGSIDPLGPVVRTRAWSRVIAFWIRTYPDRFRWRSRRKRARRTWDRVPAGTR